VGGEQEVAYRGRARWVKGYERMALGEGRAQVRELREGGVYLITGGMEGIAYAMAEHLALNFQAKLCLIDDSPIPARSHWQQWLTTHDGDDLISRRIKRAQALEELGAEVLILKASVYDLAGMELAVAQVRERFGDLNGVLFSFEGQVQNLFSPIEETTPERSEQLFQSTVYALYVLDKVLQNVRLDFCLLLSSLASVLGGPGYAAYSAAASFMNHFSNYSGRKSSSDWISINLDALGPDRPRQAGTGNDSDNYEMTAQEGIEVLRLIISRAAPGQVIVSTGDLALRVQQWITDAGSHAAARRNSGVTALLHPRPALQTPYAPPTSDLERAIADIWQKELGIEQVGVYDNFFDLGGDSLIALQVIAELKKGLNKSIPVVSLYEGLTVKALAELLEASEQAEEEAATQATGRNERMLRRKQFQEKERSRKRQADS
ncbi:MAG TPA: KR domain-containing protein, partial [Blastocatellia bacterium]|nr:KR domain-containing protein [Blastocatellia bacterium]